MVLGIRSKSRKKVAIQVDYVIDVVEIKPWPLFQSPKPVQSVLLQWDNGGHGSGSFISGVGDGSIAFSESFRLQVTLLKETSRKGLVHYRYQKNSNLEFYLYEFRNDKGMKGQLLGSAVVNFADCEIIKEPVTMSIPVNWKKSSKNLGQPLLYINVQPLGKENEDVNGSVSGSVNGENEDEAEIASFTDDDADDDVSSHSSHTINSSAFETTSSSPSLSVKNGSEIEKDNAERISEGLVREHTGPTAPAGTFNHLGGNSSQFSSKGISSKLRSSANYSAAFPYTPHEEPKPGLKKSVTLTVQSSSSSFGNEENYEKSGYHNQRLVDGNVRMPEYAQKSTTYSDVCRPADEVVSSFCIQEEINIDHRSCINSRATQEDQRIQKANVKEATLSDSDFSHSGDMVNNEKEGNGQKDNQLRVKECSNEAKLSRISQDADTKQFILRSDTFMPNNRDTGASNSMVKSNKLKHVKTMQLPLDPVENNRLSDNSKFRKKSNGIEVAKSCKDAGLRTAKELLPNRAELDSEVETLKEELKEAAALEVSLYSVVAEHGSSTNKIHAPARRLSRFYFHVCKAKGKKANAARAAISGLILVSKACGNDVQRLTFWLSNSIVLRTIISQTLEKLQLPARSVNHEIGVNISDGVELETNGFSTNKGGESNTTEGSDGWDDPRVFMLALEKFEAWIFSRIVESVWWQTMTPHMQSPASKGSSSKKAYGKRNNLGDFDHGNFSIDLWKKAFKDACERLCPPRAGGHECGCLHVLARLVMEQLVNRLDVAMFNAILRENAEEMPTDPVSDPISDSNVLPIPAGKSSFGAGVQLKNAIGSWSRWLTDLFDIDDTDAPDDNNEQNDRAKLQTPFKPFRLLNALSDLMMLPFEMLADRSTRKEVCPTFAAPLIKRVLYSFVPDEFSPNPIPVEVLEVLDSEDNSYNEEDFDTSFPFMASPTIYLPPSAASLIRIMGEVGSQTLKRNGPSVLKKAYTSDGELDELDSPFASIIVDNIKGSSTATPISILKKKGNQQLRYQLLREAWKDNE